MKSFLITLILILKGCFLINAEVPITEIAYWHVKDIGTDERYFTTNGDVCMTLIYYGDKVFMSVVDTDLNKLILPEIIFNIAKLLNL